MAVVVVAIAEVRMGEAEWSDVVESLEGTLLIPEDLQPCLYPGAPPSPGV